MFNSQRLAIVASVVTFLILLVIGWHLGQPDPAAPGEGFHFHPDAVLEMTWTAGGQTFHYQRTSRAVEWQPGLAPERAERLLNPLSSVRLHPMHIPSSGEVEIEIAFGSDNRWRGLYHGGDFVWTQGAKRGQGFRADGAYRALFQEGRYFFAPHSWTWCEARPQQLKAQVEGQPEFALHQGEKGGWVDVDSTRVEQWLSRNCTVAVEHFRDLDLFPLGWGLATDAVNVQFQGGARKEWKRYEGFWRGNGKAAAESAAFTSAWVQLASFRKP